MQQKLFCTLLTLLCACVTDSAFAASPTPSETPAPASATVDASDQNAEVLPSTAPASAAVPRESDDSVETAIVQEGPTPVPNSKALDESGLSNPSGNGQFKRPLLFAPEDNGLKPENPQIKWSFDKNGMRALMGGLKLEAEQIAFRIGQGARKNSPSDLVEESNGASAITSLSFSWPTVLTKSGTFTIEKSEAAAKPLWSREVTEEQLVSWRVKRVNFKSQLQAHENSTWGLSDVPRPGTRALKTPGDLRACLTQKKSDIEHVKICTPPFKVIVKGQRLTLVPSTINSAPTVAINGKAIGDTGLINAPVGRELVLKVNFANDSFVEIASQPVQLDLLDVVESKDGREIILTGRSTMPLGKKKIISRPERHFWSATGVQQDTIWQTALPVDSPTIRVLGTYNLPFTYLFRYENLPRENDRVFVSERSSTGSYSSTPLIRGYVAQKGPVSSKENSAKRSEVNEFEWNFSAPTVGQYNRARLQVPGLDGQGKWVAHHTVFHGYPVEASARLTGVLTAGGQNVILGELASSVWLESLGFTQNDLISRQRWGVAARYFKSLTSISVGPDSTVEDFSAWNADLKYNLVRGMWNRDELFGLIASTQKVTISGLSAQMGGVGVYWARTMPRVFADLFELFPLLDYSKYVDVEFIYYPVTVSGDAVAGASYNLNFHGKVFWSKRVFGEAGFGIKQFEYAIPNTGAVEFSTAYGTLGVGVVF